MSQPYVCQGRVGDGDARVEGQRARRARQRQAGQGVGADDRACAVVVQGHRSDAVGGCAVLIDIADGHDAVGSNTRNRRDGIDLVDGRHGFDRLIADRCRDRCHRRDASHSVLGHSSSRDRCLVDSD